MSTIDNLPQHIKDGNDRLYGWEGDDSLRGGAGNG